MGNVKISTFVHTTNTDHHHDWMPIPPMYPNFIQKLLQNMALSVKSQQQISKLSIKYPTTKNFLAGLKSFSTHYLLYETIYFQFWHCKIFKNVQSSILH